MQTQTPNWSLTSLPLYDRSDDLTGLVWLQKAGKTTMD
jgi:hypothetical protein